MATYTALVDVKINTARANKGLKNIESSLLSLNKRSAKTNQFLQRMEATFGRIDKQMSVLNKTQINSIRAMRSMSKGAKDATDEINKLKKQISDLQKKIKGAEQQGTRFANFFKKLNKVYKENAYLIQSISAGLLGFIQYNLLGGLKRLSDQFILMQSRLRVVNDSQRIFNRNLQQSYEIAQATRQPLFQVANTLARIGRNSSVLQKDFVKLGRITMTIGKSFQVAGATIEEANNAMIQLSQAFASGRLQGDELRSVLELAPRLAQGIAKQIGISVGSMRAFAKEGKLTTEVLRKAIAGASREVDRDFKKIEQTIGQAVTNVNSTLLMLVGTTNQITGTNQKFVKAIERINKALQGLAGGKALIAVGDALGFVADNLDAIIKIVASAAFATAVIAFSMFTKVVVSSLGLVLVPIGLATAAMYKFLDGVVEVNSTGTKSFKDLAKNSSKPLTETQKKIARVTSEIEFLRKEIKGFQEAEGKSNKGLIGQMIEKDIQLLKTFFGYLKKIGLFLDGIPFLVSPEPEGRGTAAQRGKAGTKSLEKVEDKLTKKIKERIGLERDNREEAIRGALERLGILRKQQREAEEAFLKSYRQELAAVKRLNAERQKARDVELGFRRDPRNLYDTFGAQEYADRFRAGEGARKQFTKILEGMDAVPGQFGQVMNEGRVSAEGLTASLETDALRERFKKEPALRKALALEAKKIAEQLNADLLDGEERRLVESKNMYLRHLDQLKSARKSVRLDAAMAEVYGDPSRLRGAERASFEKMSGKVAGEEARVDAIRSGKSSSQANVIKSQTEELTKQRFELQRIIQLNGIRTQTEMAGYNISQKESDLLLERNVITGQLTKEAKITRMENESLLNIAKELNIPAKELKVLKSGMLDLDLESLNLTEDEFKKGRALYELEKARQEAKKAGMPTGEFGDTASMNALQSGVTSGVMGAGGQSGQRAMQTAQAYQAAGGGLIGAINAIFALVLSNKKVMEAISKIFDSIMEPIDAILDPLGELISAVMLLMKPFKQLNKILGKALGAVLKSLTQLLHPFSELMEALQPVLVMLGAALQVIVQFISALVGGISDFIKDIVELIIGPADPNYKSETLLAEEANLLSSIEESLEGAADALKKINDVVFEITNSALNLLAPSVKLEDAKAKYDELFELAKTIGSDEYIDEYTNFAKEYLQQSQDVLKSSKAYQDIYDDVLDDLNTLQGAEFRSTSENLTEDLKGAAFNLDLIGSDLGESIRQVVKNFQAGAIDFVDVMRYVAYKRGQVETDLELKQMAEFGSIDIQAEFDRIAKARGRASSSSSVAQDFAALGLDLLITNPTHYAVGITRNSDGSMSVGAIGEDDAALGMIAAAHANGIPVIHDPETARYLAAGGSAAGLSGSFTGGSAIYSTESLIGDIGTKTSFAAKSETDLFGGGFDILKMFENLGQLIIDGLIAALKAIGAGAEAILKAVFGFIGEALSQVTDLGTKILGYILGPVVEAIGKVGNLAGVVLGAIFQGIANISVSAGQFLTGLFYPILKLAGEVKVDQFFSALIYPIMRALSQSFSGVSDLFQKMVIDPIMNAIGMNNLPDPINIAKQAVAAVGKVIGLDVEGIEGWNITDFFTKIETEIKKLFSADLTKVFGGWDLGEFLEDVMDSLNDLFSIDVPSGHIKLLPNPFKGNFGGPSHFIDFKFQEGGLAQGPSHSDGGIKAVVAPRTARESLIEFEGGEYIIKKSTVDFLGEGILSAINNKPEVFLGGEHFYSYPLTSAGAMPFGSSIPAPRGSRSPARTLPITGGYRYEEGGLSKHGFPSKDYGDLGTIGGKEAKSLLGDFFSGSGPGFPLKIIDFSMKTGGDVQRLFDHAGLGGPYGAEGHWTAKNIGEHSAAFKIGELKNGGRVDKFEGGGSTTPLNLSQTGVLGGKRGKGVFDNALGFMQDKLPLLNHKGRLNLASGTMPPPFWGCEIREGGTFGYEWVCHGAKASASIDYNLMAPSISPRFVYEKAEDGGLVGMGKLPVFKSGGLVAGGGFKSRCNACGSGGRSASYGGAVGYSSGGYVTRFENGGYNPLTYQNLDSEGVRYTTSQITNESIGLFDPLLFEGFEGLQNYETGFQDVGNQLVDQFKLAYIQTTETNRLLGLLIAALYSEIGRLERTIITYLESLPTVVQTMDTNLQAAINKMNTEVKEEIRLMGEGIEEEIRKIAPSFGVLIIEIQDAFVAAILEAGLDKLFKESLTALEETIPPVVKEGVEGAFDKLITGNDNIENQTRRALESVFTGTGDGIKVVTQSMGEPWYDDMEEIFDNFLTKITKRIAVGGLIAAVAAAIGGTAGIVAAALGVAAAFWNEIEAAYAGSDLQTVVDTLVEITKAAIQGFIGLLQELPTLDSAIQDVKNFISAITSSDLGLITDIVYKSVLALVGAIFTIDNWKRLGAEIWEFITKGDLADLLGIIGTALVDGLRKAILGAAEVIGNIATAILTASLSNMIAGIGLILETIRTGDLGVVTTAAYTLVREIGAAAVKAIGDVSFAITVAIGTAVAQLIEDVLAFNFKIEPPNETIKQFLLQVVLAYLTNGVSLILQAIHYIYQQIPEDVKEKVEIEMGRLFQGFVEATKAIIDFILMTARNSLLLLEEVGILVEGFVADIFQFIFGSRETDLFPSIVRQAGISITNAGEEKLKELPQLMLDFVGDVFQFFVDLLTNIVGEITSASIDTSDMFNLRFGVDILGASLGIGPKDAPNYLEIDFLPGFLRSPLFSTDGPTQIKGDAYSGGDKKEQGGMIYGPSHAAGGVAAVIDGVAPVEIEGGEYIINKKTVDLLGKRYFDTLNSLRKGGVRQFGGGNYAPVTEDMTNLGGYLINEVHETTGNVRKILGHHGVRAVAGFNGPFPVGDFKIFGKGGLLKLNPGAYASEELKNIAEAKTLMSLGPIETGLGQASFKVDGIGNTFPPGIGIKAYPEFKKNDLGNAISNAVGGIRIEDGGFIDPELRTLMTELIQTVRDKEMGVNIYNDTGQNMQLDDGEGEGFDESSYRETINLA